MIKSFWNTGDYPILINPTFKELEVLECWDTIRICVDNYNLAFASGHGNTHDSIIKMMRAHLNPRCLPDTYILFIEDGQFWFNLEDVGLGRKVRSERVLRKLFSIEHADILRDVISLREQKR